MRRGHLRSYYHAVGTSWQLVTQLHCFIFHVILPASVPRAALKCFPLVHGVDISMTVLGHEKNGRKQTTCKCFNGIREVGEEVVKNALVTQTYCTNDTICDKYISVFVCQLVRFLELRIGNVFSCHIYILKKPVLNIT